MILERDGAGFELGDEAKVHGIARCIDGLGEGGCTRVFVPLDGVVELLTLLFIQHARVVAVLLLATTASPDPAEPSAATCRLLVVGTVTIAACGDLVLLGGERLLAQLVTRYGTVEADVLVVELPFELFEPRAAVALCDGDACLLLVGLLDLLLLLLEELDVLFAVVAALAEVVPGPYAMAFVHLVEDGGAGEAEQGARPVLGELLRGGAEAAILCLARVKVEEVGDGDDVAVLLVVEGEAELFEEQLCIHLWHLWRHLFAHDESACAADGLEDVLVVGRRVGACDERIELFLRLADFMAGERVGVGVPVDGERLETGELVDAVAGVLDEGGVPVGVCGDGGEFGEGDAGGEGMLWIGEAVLVADVDVAYGELEVVDDLCDEGAGEGLVLLLVLGRDAYALAAVSAEELCVCELLLLCGLGTLRLFFLIDLDAGVLGSGEEVDIFDEDAYGLALEVGPGDGEGEVAEVALLDVYWEAELVERRGLETEVAELDVAGPDADVELACVEAVDVGCEQLVKERGEHSFKHGGVSTGSVASESDEVRIARGSILAQHVRFRASVPRGDGRGASGRA
ncbi:hypothetical protein L1887_54054 [Cichorium endivia]|nr:hypothetical protein L1887_54054 [Cichorium endivia]